MEDVVYSIESDPSKAISANNKLADSFIGIESSTSKLNDVFRNFDNITRYFRQFTGYNPKEYRNRFRQG